ncbi:MAG: hypothetical protein IKD76_07735 [Clostridia bacterium]|nr:hypothetical protein [Clostridia bacterium]
MYARTKVDKFGRLFIPKEISYRMGLRNGFKLAMTMENHSIRLKPVKIIGQSMYVKAVDQLDRVILPASFIYKLNLFATELCLKIADDYSYIVISKEN